MKHRDEIAAFVRNGDYVQTSEGVLIHGAILARGTYVHTVNGQDERYDDNLVVTEGLNYMLDVALTGGTASAAWYLAPYSANATPLASWTAASFATSASELTSNTTGYSEATRQAWTPGAIANGALSNYDSRAAFSIVTPNSVIIYGAGLLSTATKGSTAGRLISATKFASPRQLSNGDTFQLGYQVQLSDS